jgi:hypothetical protein
MGEPQEEEGEEGNQPTATESCGPPDWPKSSGRTWARVWVARGDGRDGRPSQPNFSQSLTFFLEFLV